MTDNNQIHDAAQAEQVRLAAVEECARVAENYPSSGSATEHPVEYWIRALAALPPAAPVETERCEICGSGDFMMICEGCWNRRPRSSAGTDDLIRRLSEMPSSLNDALRMMDEARHELERLRSEPQRGQD